MPNRLSQETSPIVATLDDLAKLANYSLMDTLNCDPDAKANGTDHAPRQVFTGHYVPVKPTPIKDPEYVAHSKNFFRELGFADSMAQSTDFVLMFSGDISHVPVPMRKVGWACGYALSIFGTEYYQQCPFQTGNGYGDGRAVSVLEAVINGSRWEMQLKGGGRTPYCRGADGRAVLRSSVREFLAQEHMHALGVPTSRSLSLYVSKTEQVKRPWYSEGSHAKDPDMMISEAVAISTRVAPSFIRVGQLELFGRRARKKEHPKAIIQNSTVPIGTVPIYSMIIARRLEDLDDACILQMLRHQARQGVDYFTIHAGVLFEHLQYVKHVLIKGGHLGGDAVDVLWTDGQAFRLRGERIDTQHTHGTGCVLSAAITARLASGEDVLTAVTASKRFITEAIRTNPCLGHGHGPVNMLSIVPGREPKPQ